MINKMVGCPIHGTKYTKIMKISITGNSLFERIDKIHCCQCDKCKKIYISIDEFPHKNYGKIKPGYTLENIEKFRIMPKEFYVYDKKTKEGLPNTNKFSLIDKFYDASCKKKSKLRVIHSLYFPDTQNYYISKEVAKEQKKYFLDHNVLTINNLIINDDKECKKEQKDYLSIDMNKQSNNCENNIKKAEKSLNQNNDNTETSLKEDFIPKTLPDKSYVELKNNFVDLDKFEKNEKVAKAYLDSNTIFNPYQYLPWLYMFRQNENRLIISDEVGLGKTIEAGILIKEQIESDGNSNVLVICPTFLRKKWKDELQDKFYYNSEIYGENTNDIESNIIILPLTRISKFLENKNDLSFSMIVIDEAHYFKNDKSKRFKVLKMLLDKNLDSKLIFMSATPINNKQDDFYSLEILMNGRPYESTNTTKKQTYIKLAKRYVKDIYVDLSANEQQLYDTTDLLPSFSGTIYRHIGASCLYALTKYAENCNNENSAFKTELANSMEELFMGEDYETEWESSNISKFYNQIHSMKTIDYDSKLNLLNKLIHNISDNKIIIFSHYIETIKYLYSSLSELYNCAFVYANNVSKNINIENTKNKFSDAKKWFNAQDDKNKTILICSDSCREGIDLDAASCLINYDLPFNPSILEQRIGRIDRMSQKKDMTIYNFHVNQTYDDRLHYILQTKLMLINYFSEYGIGNPLAIAEDNESTIDKYIRYFSKNAKIKMSGEDFSVIKKILRKVGSVIPKDISQKELIARINKYKDKIVELFDDKQLWELTEEELILQKKRLTEILNFPEEKSGICIVNENVKNFLCEKANTDAEFRKRISMFIKNYDLKLKDVEETGNPMKIYKNDIIDIFDFTTNVEGKNIFITQSMVDILKKAGVDISWN